MQEVLIICEWIRQERISQTNDSTQHFHSAVDLRTLSNDMDYYVAGFSATAEHLVVVVVVIVTWRWASRSHWSGTSPTTDIRNVTSTSTTTTSCLLLLPSSYFTTTLCRWFYAPCTAFSCERPTDYSHRYSVYCILFPLCTSTMVALQEVDIDLWLITKLSAVSFIRTIAITS